MSRGELIEYLFKCVDEWAHDSTGGGKHPLRNLPEVIADKMIEDKILEEK